MPHWRRNHWRDSGVVQDMNRPTLVTAVVPLLLTALVAIGCGSPSASPSPTPGASPSATPGVTPTPNPSPTQPPATQVTSAAQAAALVFAREHIGRMSPLMANMVGQSTWYEAFEDGDGYTVSVTAGAGDCQAGCIERHTWTYHVSLDGTVTLVSEEGDDIGIPTATGTTDPLTLNIILTSGPTCPVVQNPPDPNCAPRPVVNAEVVVFDASGQQVASGTSAADGTVALRLPAGAYYVVPEMVENLLGKAAPLAFAGVGGDTVGLIFEYDTGIR